MNTFPCIPDSAPFTADQRAWLNGYLAGLFSGAAVQTASSPAPLPNPPAKKEPLLILFGSQTGTAEGLANRIGKDAAAHGFTARVLEMNAFASANLAAQRRLLLVTSTWGEGDPPDNAAAFWDYLNSTNAPRMDHIEYSVLALGDTNYSDFCGAGKKFDARLEALGARRIQSRADCDTDYESPAKEWLQGVWNAFGQSPANSSSTPPGRSQEAQPPASESPSIQRQPAGALKGYSRSNPFPARLLRNALLNGPGSDKETRHIELSLEGSGLAYETGDALGVVPSNCPALVDEILQALGFDGEEAAPDPKGNETSLRGALTRHYAITQPATALVTAVARQKHGLLEKLLSPEHKLELDDYLQGREIIDLLIGAPNVRFSPAEFVSLLRKLQPRLYSISSSPNAHPGEVHLTVGIVRYTSHERPRKGVCSTFLADRAGDAAVPVFVQPSHGFRLPTDGATPIIMVGPGTGIAPFRAFLEERQTTGAPGRNWLFFGDQRQECDFLYREQLETMRAQGTLTRLDTAFSRDQTGKVYVQHRMLEHAAELWAWLDAGAHIYVCGDAKRMAKDVDAALHKIIETAGNRSPEQAAGYVRELKTLKRYQRDVY